MDRPCYLCSNDCFHVEDVEKSDEQTRAFCNNNTCQPFYYFSGRDDDDQGVAKKRRKNKANVNILIVPASHDEIERKWENQMWHHHANEIKDTIILWESFAKDVPIEANAIQIGTVDATKLPLECNFMHIFPFWETLLISDKYNITDPEEIGGHGMGNLEEAMSQMAGWDIELGTDYVGTLTPLGDHQKVMALYGRVFIRHIARYYHEKENSGFTEKKRMALISLFLEVDHVTAAKIDGEILSCVNKDLDFVYDGERDAFWVIFEGDAGLVVDRITRLAKTIFEMTRSYHKTHFVAIGEGDDSNDVYAMRRSLQAFEECMDPMVGLRAAYGSTKKRDFTNYMYVNSLVDNNSQIRNVIMVVGSAHIAHLTSLFEDGVMHKQKTIFDVTRLSTEKDAGDINYATFAISWHISEWMDEKGIDKNRSLQYAAFQSLAQDLALKKSQNIVDRPRDSRKTPVKFGKGSDTGNTFMYVAVLIMTGYYYMYDGYDHELKYCTKTYELASNGYTLQRFALGLEQLIMKNDFVLDLAADKMPLVFEIQYLPQTTKDIFARVAYALKEEEYL